jgi:hypothetical protein
MRDFVDGTPLSASMLNALGRNIRYLYGLAAGRVMPFNSFVGYGDLDDSPADLYYYVRHRYRYLHYNIVQESIDDGDLGLYFDGNLILGQDDSDPATGYIDLNSYTSLLGQWVKITVNYDATGGTPGVPKIRILHLFESDVTALARGTSGASYASPPVWHHGDIPTAADMNKYRDALNFLNDTIGGGAINYPVFMNRNHQPGNVDTGQESNLRFFHRHRWFHYFNTEANVKLVDETDADNEHSISDTSGDFKVLDLDTIDWMTPGKPYRVEEIDWCAEDYEP